MDFNTCPRQQCRGRTTHSTLRHWTPVYLGEIAYVVKAHATGRCHCHRSLLTDLARTTWDTLTYFARELRHRLARW